MAIKRKKLTKHNAVATARSWLTEYGIRSVPLWPRTKKPKGGPGWNKVIIDDEDIENHFEEDDNVGGLWGDPSQGVVDIDLDWDEAAAVAPRLLPRTLTYGRASRPSTHYLYRCIGIKTFKLYPKGNLKEGVIVEVRSTGSQSVLPPSIHPENERYEINDDREITRITRSMLENCVQKVAAASVFVRKYPESGARHDYVHAMTGALLMEQWSHESVAEFAAIVLDAAEDKESDRPQRDRTVANTIKSFGHGNIAGWSTLANWLSTDEIHMCKRWLRGVSKPAPDTLKKTLDSLARPLPSVSLEPPGLVGEIAKWANHRAFVRQPLLGLAAGFMSIALASANRYVFSEWRTPLQPFFLLLAPTASGKESALDSVSEIAVKAKIGNTIVSGFQSPHAMMDMMANPPNMACWLWDEVAKKLKSIGKQGGGPDAAVVAWLLSMYGKGASRVAGMPGRKASINTIEHPYLLVMAAAQPSHMIEAITQSDVSLGLMNRFVLFDAGDEVPPTNPNRSFVFPSKIETALINFTHVEAPKNDDFVQVRCENSRVYQILDAYATTCRERAAQGGGWEMWGRTHQNCLILAGLLAIGVNHQKPLVTELIAQWAIEFSSWSTDRWTMRIESSSSRSMVEAQSKQLERLIAEARKLAPKGRSAKEREAMAKGFMPRSPLLRMCRNIRSRDLDESLQFLQNAGLIGSGDFQGIDVYWCEHPG